MPRAIARHNLPFAHLPRRGGTWLYAAELDGPIVKVGVTSNPFSRMKLLAAFVRNSSGAAIRRVALCHVDGRALQGWKHESELLERVSAVGVRMPGTREFFRGIDFDQALACMPCAPSYDFRPAPFSNPPPNCAGPSAPPA